MKIWVSVEGDQDLLLKGLDAGGLFECDALRFQFAAHCERCRFSSISPDHRHVAHWIRTHNCVEKKRPQEFTKRETGEIPLHKTRALAMRETEAT